VEAAFFCCASNELALMNMAAATASDVNVFMI
jgi:hypothetical protein